MTATQSVQAVHRSDYQPPAFWIEKVELEFDLDPQETLVTARIHVIRNEDLSSNTLELVGENVQLKSVAIDGEILSEDRYTVGNGSLTLTDVPDSCVIETKVVVAPVTNKTLSGLYQTSGNYCTQCEAVGFRRITYFLDRPDVMATYQVTIRGDKKSCPVMLSLSLIHI